MACSSLRLRAAWLLAVVGSDAALLSGYTAPRSAARRAWPRPVLMADPEAPEAASAEETAPAPSAAAPVAAVAPVDQAELDFEERLAMLASQVGLHPLPNRHHRAPLRLAVACLGRTVRSRAQPRAAPALGPQIPTTVPDTKDQYKTDSVEKGSDESWISGEFWALCAQDLKEISWPKRAQV